ncbi:SRPBCC family protein [Amycolatopsis sp. NPDC049253]|jgi:carbon monoxide dehydrogenase subunit G|uniref:SRPBCC family protein n=1 Tax=Amycolatopsis sp. NPDC049253 TaxID=3155274 RepID=UPI0034377AED
MLIRNQFEVAQPVDKVWRFFDDVPAVATCLPGAELTEELGDERYRGRVGVRLGPVSLKFDGVAAITSRDEDARRLVVDASGAEARGRGQAAMVVTATLARADVGTRVDFEQDLQVSGAAAQYGRGMIADVSSVLMRQFALNVQEAIARAERGETAEARHAAAPARGFTIGLQATLMALKRVFRRFFAPYPSTPA